MNHQQVYNSIIENARKQNRIRNNENYYEDHHIIPRCIGGDDSIKNKVLLTAREHFVCHKLLTYIYQGNYKIYHAFHFMAFMNKRKYEISSRDYEYAIELFRSIPVDHRGEKNTMYGKKHSKKSIEKNRISNLGNYEERYGKEKADEMKRKLGEKSAGENNPMANKSFYDIWFIKYGKEIADKKIEEYKKNKTNRVWVRNVKVNKSKQIKQEELENYISEGWEIGRQSQRKRKPISEETRLKQSNKRKEYWKRKTQQI
jgi:hypothetical protein